MIDLERVREALELGVSLATVPEESIVFTLAENERFAHLKEDAEREQHIAKLTDERDSYRSRFEARPSAFDYDVLRAELARLREEDTRLKARIALLVEEKARLREALKTIADFDGPFAGLARNAFKETT